MPFLHKCDDPLTKCHRMWLSHLKSPYLPCRQGITNQASWESESESSQPALLQVSRAQILTSRIRRSVIGYRRCASARLVHAQAGSRHRSKCCWSGRRSWGCSDSRSNSSLENVPTHGRTARLPPNLRSGEWSDDAQPIFHEQSIVHVLAPQCCAPRKECSRHDHRVIDRELVLLRQGAPHLVGLDRQVLDRTQGLDSCEKGCSVLPAEPGLSSTIYERFVQDLNTDPRPLLQDFLSPIRLGPVVKQVENNIRVRELSAHAQRRGSVARPWAVCPESGAILAKLHQREAHAEHAQPHRPLPGQSDRPPSGRVPAQDRRAAAPRENFPIWKLASSPH